MALSETHLSIPRQEVDPDQKEFVSYITFRHGLQGANKPSHATVPLKT